MLPRLILLLAALALSFGAAAAPAEAPRVYSFYVVPQLSHVRMYEAWAPLLQRISELAGYKLQLEIPPSIPDFEAVLDKGVPDFAFSNPYLAVAVRKKIAYVPLVRSDAMPLQGVLVVRKDSPIASVQELKGKIMAFPAPNSFAASLYMRSLLAKQGVAVVPRFVGAHSNVYRQVVYGEVVAGGGANYSLEQEPEEVRDQLRVLFRTPLAKPHPVLVHPRIPAKVREALTAAVFKLAATADGQAMLARAQLPKPVAADYDRDYRPMESLGLTKYYVPGAD